MAKFNSWSNQPIRLFHGTTKTDAINVYRQIDPWKGRTRTDFGTGFYTTSWYEQAKTWAIFVASLLPGESPAVVAFDVDRLDLSVLESLSFVRGCRDAHDYWSLVNHCRLGGCHFPDSCWYDIVVGPVAAWPWTRRKSHLDFDQISFHSLKATSVLDGSRKEIIDVN